MNVSVEASCVTTNGSNQKKVEKEILASGVSVVIADMTGDKEQDDIIGKAIESF